MFHIQGPTSCTGKLWTVPGQIRLLYSINDGIRMVRALLAFRYWKGRGSRLGKQGITSKSIWRKREKKSPPFYRNSPWAVSVVHLICTLRRHLCVIVSVKVRATNSEKTCTEESTHFLQFPCSYVITLSTTTKNTVIFDCTKEQEA